MNAEKVWCRESAGEEKKNKAKSRANKQKDEREGQEARRERWNPTANMTASHAANTNTANRQQTDRQTAYRTLQQSRTLRVACKVAWHGESGFSGWFSFGICGLRFAVVIAIGHKPILSSFGGFSLSLSFSRVIYKRLHAIVILLFYMTYDLACFIWTNTVDKK